MHRSRSQLFCLSVFLLLTSLTAKALAPPAPLHIEVPVVAGRVHSAVPIKMQLGNAPDAGGAVSLSGSVDLRRLDSQLAALLNAALGRRPECKLQVDIRRAWLSAPSPNQVSLEVRGRVMQPLCGKLRQVLGGPLDGPSSAANASLRLRVNVDAQGRPLIWVERVEMWTDRPELDVLLKAWRPPEEIRLDLQAQIDEALANWPPELLRAFSPRLQSVKIEQGEGGLSVQFRGVFKAGFSQWLELLGKLASSPAQ